MVCKTGTTDWNVSIDKCGQVHLQTKKNKFTLDGGCAITGLAENGGRITGRLDGGQSGPAQLSVTLCGANQAEITIWGDGPMPAPCEFPGPAAPQAGDLALVPIGEGFAFPVDDPEVRVIPEECPYWDTSRSMGFMGLLRGDAWLVLAMESAADAFSRVVRGADGLLRQHLLWLPELGKWGPRRTLRILAGDAGGISAACRAYRQYRDTLGPVLTLKDKAVRVPGVDKLVGACSVWVWHDDYEKLLYSQEPSELDVSNAGGILQVAGEIKAAGVERAMFGTFFKEDVAFARQLRRDTGYLVTKYDNFTDVLDEETSHLIPKARIDQCDYTTRRMRHWPQDILIQPDGTPCEAWALRGTDGVMHPQHVLCASCAAPAAQDEVASCAEAYDVDAWFIDVAGNSLSECYSPRHPMSRTECVKAKAELLDAMNWAGLVSGTEEGIECLASYFCYSEGRMSPQQYRIDYLESGRKKAHLYGKEEHEEAFDRFMLNPRYRVPLWQLVYHDVAVSFWYWGDSSNCCPELLPTRDLFNILYGTPPLYSFHLSDWPALKEPILNSCRRACPVAQKTGYEQMARFEWLDDARLVQRTIFGDGTQVVVNFSDKPFILRDGRTVPAQGHLVEEGEVPV